MLTFSGLSLRRGTRLLISDASFTMYRGEKVGIVGANGSGKSSLLALMRGELQPDAGSFDMPSQLVVAHVAQEMAATERAAIEFVHGRRRASCARSKQPSLQAEATRCRRGARRAARPLRSDRRLRRAQPRRHAAAWSRLRRRGRNATGRGVLGRLAHAAEPRAGADVPLRPAAARRADQPPRPRRRAVARGLAARLSRHAAADRARPRVPRRDRRSHRAHRATDAARLYSGNYSAFEEQRAAAARAAAVALSSGSSARSST